MPHESTVVTRMGRVSGIAAFTGIVGLVFTQLGIDVDAAQQGVGRYYPAVEGSRNLVGTTAGVVLGVAGALCKNRMFVVAGLTSAGALGFMIGDANVHLGSYKPGVEEWIDGLLPPSFFNTEMLSETEELNILPSDPDVQKALRWFDARAELLAESSDPFVRAEVDRYTTMRDEYLRLASDLEAYVQTYSYRLAGLPGNQGVLDEYREKLAAVRASARELTQVAQKMSRLQSGELLIA